MAGIGKSAQRAIAVVALLILAAWALRGYIPGDERVAGRERSPGSPAAVFVVVALLTAAVAVIGFAIIQRLRDRPRRRAPAGTLPRSSASTGRPSWRFSLAALALVIGWLLLVMLLTRLDMQGPIEEPSSPPEPTPDRSTPAPPRTETAAPPPTEPEEEGTNVVGYLIPPMLVLMVLVIVGTAIASRRQRRSWAPYPVIDDLGHAPAGPAAADSLARAAEIGLAEIGDLSREPREAIIACYAAMERELTRVPGAVPQDFDTPSEVLARAVDHHALRADSATELVELFEEARFSPHVMTEAHRDAAVRVLQLVLAELRSVV